MSKKYRRYMYLMLFCMLLIGGCADKQQRNKLEWVTENTNSRKEMADIYAEKIAKIMEEGDVNSLVELFSVKAIEDVGLDKLETDAKELFEFFLGSNYTYEGNLSAHETNSHGKKTLRIDAIYKITTDQEEYRMYFVFQPVNDEDSSQLGLSHIVATTEANYQEEDFTWLYLDGGAGVYIIE